MVAKVVSPLHKVIDAGRWDAERLLGRLIVVCHAAFVDAGFVPLPLPGRKRGPVPREAGRMASALSLRYTVPELLHRQEADDAAATAMELKLRVYGREILLYVRRDDGRSAAWFWEMVDALDVAPFLSGGLDATARSLRRDARMVGLWRGLSDRLCRPALADLCRRNGVPLEPSFMSLPCDVKAAILARLADAGDLVWVERTCRALRRLVAERDRELWKPLYDAIDYPELFRGDSTEMSWKERYARARPRRQLLQRIFWPRLDDLVTLDICLPLREDRRPRSYNWPPFDRLALVDRLIRNSPPFDPYAFVDRVDPRELRADPVTKRRKRRTVEKGKLGQTRPFRGAGGGAVHSPSSRYRWKHR